MSREESLQFLKMKTKEADLPGLLGIVNLVEAQQMAHTVTVLEAKPYSNLSGRLSCIDI
jgi:hypothetical protein